MAATKYYWSVILSTFCIILHGRRWKLQTVSKPLTRQSKFISASPPPVFHDGSLPGSSQLTALLVAELKSDPELPHVAAREDVWDPLDDEGAGVLLICSSRACSSQWPFTHSSSSSGVVAFLKTYQLGGRCAAPWGVWPAGADQAWGLQGVPAQAEDQGSETSSTSRRCSSQNSGKALEEAAVKVQQGFLNTSLSCLWI